MGSPMVSSRRLLESATPSRLTYALCRPHLTILPLLSAVRACIQEGTRFEKQIFPPPSFPLQNVLVSKALETAEARKQYDKTRSEDDKKAFEEACAASANVMTDPDGKMKRYLVVQSWNSKCAKTLKDGDALVLTSKQRKAQEKAQEDEDEKMLKEEDLHSEFLERRGMRVVLEGGNWFLYGLRPADPP